MRLKCWKKSNLRQFGEGIIVSSKKKISVLSRKLVNLRDKHYKKPFFSVTINVQKKKLKGIYKIIFKY